MRRLTVKLFFVVLTTSIFLSACDHSRNNPGYAYMPDMYYSEPYDAYSENPVFADSITNQMPPEGSIARGQTLYPYKAKSYEDQQRAGQELINPIKADAENLAIGREQYNVYCSNCHGALGKGDGYLFTSKKFPVKPTSLVEDYVQSKPDGEIYHIITAGSLSGLMGAHGAQIKPEHRWMVINHIRTLAK
ncbi:MAG: c-type cytochrome [Bacteroidota bacterium]